MARSTEIFFCTRWTALVPVQWCCSHMVFTCSITSTLDIFPTQTHTCVIGPVIPKTSTPVIGAVATCAHITAKNICEFVWVCLLLAMSTCPVFPLPLCNSNRNVFRLMGVYMFFWGDLIMSSEHSWVSAMKWPASTVHWIILHCSPCPGSTTHLQAYKWPHMYQLGQMFWPSGWCCTSTTSHTST